MDRLRDPLQDFFINEALAYEKENIDLRAVIQQQRIQMQRQRVQLQARTRVLQQLRIQYERQRILIRIENELYVFQRDGDGVFTFADQEEPPEDIARRLGFDSDSDTESEDLLDRLMNEE